MAEMISCSPKLLLWVLPTSFSTLWLDTHSDPALWIQPFFLGFQQGIGGLIYFGTLSLLRMPLLEYATLGHAKDLEDLEDMLRTHFQVCLLIESFIWEDSYSCQTNLSSLTTLPSQRLQDAEWMPASFLSGEAEAPGPCSLEGERNPRRWSLYRCGLKGRRWGSERWQVSYSQSSLPNLMQLPNVWWQTFRSLDSPSSCPKSLCTCKYWTVTLAVWGEMGAVGRPGECQYVTQV